MAESRGQFDNTEEMDRQAKIVNENTSGVTVACKVKSRVVC